MNRIKKIFTSILATINRLLDSLNYKTVETIKKGFFFFVFLMCIVGIIIGYRIGSGKARIQSSPLTDYVNDTFRLNTNKNDGDFSEILQNEMLNEAPMNNFNKYDFPSREDFNPEFRKGIMESDNRIQSPDLTDKPFKPESPIADSPKFDLRQSNQTISPLNGPKVNDVRIDDFPKFDLKQNNPTIKPLDAPKVDGIKINDNISNPVFKDTQSPSKPEITNPDDKNIIRILDKDKNTIPQPLKNDTGIIDK